MQRIETGIEGLVVLEPKVFADSRGYFFEKFSLREFERLVGPVQFVQDNESKSCYGVVRGLHFQHAPYAQAKLVSCVRGRVLDVAVDLRDGSPTYGQRYCVELNDKNHLMLFIPKGFAHGFSVLSEEAVFQYSCDEYYHPESEDGIQALDPELGINWGIPLGRIIMSEKDRLRKCFKDK